MGVSIESGQMKTAGFQLFMVDNQTGVFHVQDFHDTLFAVDEYEHVPVLNILTHGGCNNPAQGVKTFAHVHRKRVKIVVE